MSLISTWGVIHPWEPEHPDYQALEKGALSLGWSIRHRTPPVKKYPSGEWSVCWQHRVWHECKADVTGWVVIHPMYPDVGEAVMSLDMMLRALEYQGVSAIVVIPFVPYGRQDKADQAINGWQTMARWLGSLPMKALITLDPHTGTMGDLWHQWMPHVPVVAVSHATVFDAVLAQKSEEWHGFVAPDQGSAHRAKAMAGVHKAPWIVLDKTRQSDGCVQQVQWHSGSGAPAVTGGHWCVTDDMLDSGSTLQHSVQWLKHRGAHRVSAVITHGLLSRPQALSSLLDHGLDTLWLSTSVAPFDCGLNQYPSSSCQPPPMIHWHPWAHTVWPAIQAMASSAIPQVSVAGAA